MLVRCVACRLKRTDDEVDDELSKKIDVQSDHGSLHGGENSVAERRSSHGAVRAAGHDGPQEATPQDETRTSSAT